jgi:hypothetical protein
MSGMYKENAWTKRALLLIAAWHGMLDLQSGHHEESVEENISTFSSLKLEIKC